MDVHFSETKQEYCQFDAHNLYVSNFMHIHANSDVTKCIMGDPVSVTVKLHMYCHLKYIHVYILKTSSALHFFVNELDSQGNTCV